MLISLLALLLLTVLTGLYVAAEFATVSVRKSRIRQQAHDGDRLARKLLPFLEDAKALDRYVGASQIGITLCSLLAGALGQAALVGPFSELLVAAGLRAPLARSIATVATLVGLTLFSMILGELVPKTLALQYPARVALLTHLPMRWSLRLYGLVLRLFDASARALMRLLGAAPSGHQHVHSAAELALIIDESRRGGILDPDEQRRLDHALQLGTRTARDLMVPRERVVALSAAASLAEVRALAASSPYTRHPVYEGTLDRVIGLFHLRDLVVALGQQSSGSAPPIEWRTLLRPMVRVPQATTADRCLALLRESQAHLVLIEDPEQRIVGLLALEDLLAAVMGHFSDELKATPAALPKVSAAREAAR